MPFKTALLLCLSVSAAVAADSSHAEKLDRICTDYFNYLVEKYPAFYSDALLREVPDTSLAEVKKGAERAAGYLEQLKSVDRKQLAFQDAATYDLFKNQLQEAVDGPKYYWLEFDVLPYHAGFLLAMVPAAAQGFVMKTPQDKPDYMNLVDSYARFYKQLLKKIKGQEERSILLPKPALPGVIAMFQGARAAAPATFKMTMDRMDLLPEGAETFCKQVDQKTADSLFPAMDALLNYLNGPYKDRLPESVGLWQYPGGDAYYRQRIRAHTTLALSPQEIHEMGKGHVARLMKEMAAIRKQVGFDGSQEAFHEKLRKDTRFLAKTPQDIADRFDMYIKRIEPKIDAYFSLKPKAPYGTKRLNPASEAGMTYGYYQRPTEADPVGRYLFNGSDLENRSMLWAAPLIYHELIPGHHFHLALQRENKDLHVFRARAINMTVFTEGWANYAASLADEMGLYSDPYDRYGWLVFDMFISARLVVDTGMNAMKWPLSKARAYMKEHCFQAEAEITTETLRYSTDMPGQALAYKLGFEQIRKYRAKAEKAMGEQFDIRAFHGAVLEGGSISMPLLEERVDLYIQTGK
ncbi:MAG: DUF885 domain-containing protein [Acidobacteriota bacterium]|nr:DUF885 domain-containing protein [Acidobacteriota bacterium]